MDLARAKAPEKVKLPRATTVQIHATMDEELLERVDTHVQTHSVTYQSRSHLISVAVDRLLSQDAASRKKGG